MHRLNPYNLLSAFLMMLLCGCSLDGLVKVSEPEEGRSVNIEEVTTRSGALALYGSAIGKLQLAVSDISDNVSIFTDERTRPSDGLVTSVIDARIERDNSTTGVKDFGLPSSYNMLNASRITFLHVREVIKKLNDPSLAYLLSASYALEGYSILMLAENFCSGLALSKLTFDGTVTYEIGRSTSNTLKIALALFDSSQMVEHDSSRFDVIAQVGKGRAYLSLGMLDSAYSSVEDTDIQDVFNLYYTDAIADSNNRRPYAFWSSTILSPAHTYETRNYEGSNGIQWFSEVGPVDARVPMTLVSVNGTSVGRQRKFISSNLMFPLARGITKKMIEAEYWLSKGDTRWLSAINEARSTKGIQDTVDPGTVRGREDLLFHERAFWFYLEGNRLADYRRLVRQYNRSPYEIYPTGIYEGPGGYTLYGDAFVFTTTTQNRNYSGCEHRNP